MKLKLSKKKKIIGGILGTSAIVTALALVHHKYKKKIDYKKKNEIPKIELDKFIIHCARRLTKECFTEINNINDNKLSPEDLYEYLKYLSAYKGNLYDLLKIPKPPSTPKPSIMSQKNKIFLKLIK